MHFIILISSIIIARAANGSGLKCWKCNSNTLEQCELGGYEETCQDQNQSCELEIRERDGNVSQISMGCKQTTACKAQRNQNFNNANSKFTQCRPEQGFGHSVCRQCCSFNFCTRPKPGKYWFPNDRSEWSRKWFSTTFPKTLTEIRGQVINRPNQPLFNSNSNGNYGSGAKPTPKPTTAELYDAGDWISTTSTSSSTSSTSTTPTPTTSTSTSTTSTSTTTTTTTTELITTTPYIPDMPNRGDFLDADGTSVDMFANFNDGMCSLMGYNWLALDKILYKMQWVNEEVRDQNMDDVKILMEQFQKAGQRVLARQQESCELDAGRIDCNFLHFPHTEHRCQLIRRIEWVYRYMASYCNDPWRAKYDPIMDRILDGSGGYKNGEECPFISYIMA